jgi:amino acid transporter
MICVIGTFLTVGRIWWTLARDNATPFSHFFSLVDEKLSCPIPATLLCAILCTGLGAIPLGSKTAFLDLAGSFIILTTTSYALAIGPHLFTKRKNVPPGPFWLGRWGVPINAAALISIIFFNILFCFREFTHLFVVFKRPCTELRYKFSVRDTHRCDHNELQQRHFSRHYSAYNFLVDHPWLQELSRAEVNRAILGRG